MMVLVGLVSFVSTMLVFFRHTYLLEHTLLNDAIRPLRSQRSSCDIPPAYLHMNNGPQNTTADPTLINAAIDMSKPLKIGLIMMYESTDNLTKAWSNDLLDALIENRQKYCDRHGYTLLDANRFLNYSRAASWSKLLAMEHHFKEDKFDYLLYMDMDVIIMNMDVKLETFIDSSSRMFDTIITEDFNGMNAGVFIARNSAWTMWFLRTAWEMEGLVPNKSPEGVPYPFRWEQRAFHYMTNSPAWEASGAERYPGDYIGIRSHFYKLPQCAFNSYILHPLNPIADWGASTYHPGDFLIHFAGKNGKDKGKLMRYFIEQHQMELQLQQQRQQPESGSSVALRRR